MMTKCIGIISWIPNDTRKTTRISLLNSLIKKCDELFNIPIIIIAQNWEQENDVHTSSNCIVYYYPKLGITKARQELRKKFLESDYDYLIMLDDDVTLKGTKGKEFLNQLDWHPYGYAQYGKHLLNLFAISRFALEKCEIPNVNADKEEAFEDCCFLHLLKYRVKGVEFQFNDLDLCVTWNGYEKTLQSTWFNNQNWETMTENTGKFFKKVADLDDQGLLEDTIL